MAFNVVLITNNSDKIKLDKDLITIATVSGTLKAQSSIIDPVILVDGDISSYIHCNYLSIPDFGRYYFVNNIMSVRNGVFEISAHVDVLSSFAAEIRENTAIVKRQENNWNLYLNDGSFKVYQNPHVLTKEFPSGFSTQELVLAVAGS